MNADDERRLIERVDVLAGTRTRDRRSAAVRIADLAALFDAPQRLQASKADGAPTEAEFNALVADVERLRAVLFRVMQALQGRLG